MANDNVFTTPPLERGARPGRESGVEWMGLQTHDQGHPLVVISRHGEYEGGESGWSDFSTIPDSTPVDVGDLGIVPASDGRSMPSGFLNDSPVHAL